MAVLYYRTVGVIAGQFMSVLNVAKSIHGFFNWLASEPKSHWTLRELIPVITDGHVHPNPPRPINRVARTMERVAAAAGLGGGIYMAVLHQTMAPLLMLPVAAQAAAWLVGGVTTMVLNRIVDRTEQFESWARTREFKKENKINLPRHER